MKEKDVVLYRDTFARVVFLWRNKAVIMQGTRIFEVARKELKTIDPDIIDLTFEFLKNDYRYVA